MYPCSVAEKRARRWCHQRIENSGNWFDYHSVKTKPNLDDRQDRGMEHRSTEKTAGALPLVQMEKEQKKQNKTIFCERKAITLLVLRRGFCFFDLEF